jgi:hypothetical protein
MKKVLSIAMVFGVLGYLAFTWLRFIADFLTHPLEVIAILLALFLLLSVVAAMFYGYIGWNLLRSKGSSKPQSPVEPI